MGDASLGIKSEKAPPLEDIEAANTLLLLRERAVARTKRMRTLTSFITHNAPHASFLSNQQHMVPFQLPAPDFPALPPHYYFSPEPCAFPQQPMFTYYGFMPHHPPSCYVRADAEMTHMPPSQPPYPVAFKDHRTSESSARRKRSSRNPSDTSEAKRRRKNLTKEQVRILEEMYFLTKYPQVEERMRLQGPTKLSEARIQVWFQNRRAKERRELEAKMAAQQTGAPEKDAIIQTHSRKDNSQESTENEVKTASNNRTENPPRQNNVLDNYEEKEPRKVMQTAA